MQLMSLVLAAGLAMAAPPEETVGTLETAAAVNALAVELYQQLDGEEGNLFLSPYSVSTAMAMVYAGTRGATADEIRGALHYPAPPEELPAFLGALDGEIREAAAESEIALHTANSLWPDANVEILPAYLELMEGTLDAEPNAMDYRHHAEGARKTINAWVKKQTQDKIQDLLQSGSITPDTVMVLVNAVYFKAMWASPFNSKATRERPFHLDAGEAKDVDTMYQKGHFAYGDLSEAQVLKIPYADGVFSMTVVLPKKVGGLAALEADFSAERLKEWTAACAVQDVRVYLPKFTMTWGTKDLRDALTAMGLQRVWRGDADLSGMFEEDGNFLDGVYHKTFVEVNEEGTEAAAATAAVIARTAMPAEPIPVFRADRPFLFVIRHEATGTILFIGRVVDPSA